MSVPKNLDDIRGVGLRAWELITRYELSNEKAERVLIKETSPHVASFSSLERLSG